MRHRASRAESTAQPRGSAHPLKRPRPAPAGGCYIEARLETTALASDRIIEALATGSRDFVLASSDGRVSARVRLSVTDVSMTEHRTAAGTIVVDWSRSAIARGDSKVTLSRTELRLLAALLEGDGEPRTRAELIERVWPGDQLPAAERANALGVYVCTLRKRLKLVGVQSALQTLRGLGYRLVLHERS